MSEPQNGRHSHNSRRTPNPSVHKASQLVDQIAVKSNAVLDADSATVPPLRPRPDEIKLEAFPFSNRSLPEPLNTRASRLPLPSRNARSGLTSGRHRQQRQLASVRTQTVDSAPTTSKVAPPRTSSSITLRQTTSPTSANKTSATQSSRLPPLSKKTTPVISLLPLQTPIFYSSDQGTELSTATLLIATSTTTTPPQLPIIELGAHCDRFIRSITTAYR